MARSSRNTGQERAIARSLSALHVIPACPRAVRLRAVVGETPRQVARLGGIHSRDPSGVGRWPGRRGSLRRDPSWVADRTRRARGATDRNSATPESLVAVVVGRCLFGTLSISRRFSGRPAALERLALVPWASLRGPAAGSTTENLLETSQEDVMGQSSATRDARHTGLAESGRPLDRPAQS